MVIKYYRRIFIMSEVNNYLSVISRCGYQELQKKMRSSIGMKNTSLWRNIRDCISGLFSSERLVCIYAL